MAQSWQIDPTTKDYVMTQGSPAETDSLQIPAYMRLKVRRGGWMYAPDDKYGSDLAAAKNQKGTSRDATHIENIVAVALQPIVDDGRAKGADVTVTANGRGYLGLEADIHTVAGRLDQLKIKSLGV
jgi:phage gp46-like protein